MKSIKYYTGLAWKHHVSKDFDNGIVSGGAGKGATIFLDYDNMIKYLKEDGRKWHIAELKLNNEALIMEYGNDWMATTTRNIPSIEGFKALV